MSSLLCRFSVAQRFLQHRAVAASARGGSAAALAAAMVRRTTSVDGGHAAADHKGAMFAGAGWRRQLHTAAAHRDEGSGPAEDARSSFWVMG